MHLYSLSANLDRITEICSRYGAALIEDAAESLGTMYKGKITDGGMLISKDKERIGKVRFWATQSRDKAITGRIRPVWKPMHLQPFFA